MTNILRWILFVPIAFLLGILATFPLHWIIFLYFEKGDWLYEYREGIEYSTYPFIIGHVFVRAGAYIAPSKNKNVAKGLMIFWILSTIISYTFVSIYGTTLKTSSYIGMPLGIAGAILAYFIVSEIYKNDVY